MAMEFSLNTTNPLIQIGVKTPMADCMGVSSPECCGWIHITRLKCRWSRKNDSFEARPEYVEAIKELMHGECFVPNGNWSKRNRLPTNFPLYLVLGDEKQNASNWEEVLLDLGWEKCTPFKNPNTERVNTPYQYIPDECKV